MDKQLTFSQIVKEELVSEVALSNERKEALLSAYIRINASISFVNKKTEVILKTENAKIARFIYSSIKELGEEYQIELKFDKSKNRKKKTYYQLYIFDADSLLDRLHVSFMEGKISKDIVYNDETISGYLAGAFLASGSINSPETSNYHLEITTVSENYAKWLSKLFLKYKKIEMSTKIVKRRDKYVIYFKKGDQISNFLIMIGAANSCMEFENARAYRDYTNNANRLINLDIANMSKTTEVAKRQIKEIKYIDDKLGIHNLHNPKKELLCYFRLDNESLSMLDLANKLSEELGIIITKSNVNHMFRDLHNLYLHLKGIKL